MVKLLKKLTWKDFILAAVAFVFIIVQVWLSLTMPDYMSEITKLVQTKGSKMNDILIAGGKMLACALGSLLAAVCTSICASKISSNFSANLRGQVFHKVQSFSMEEIGNFSTASLITRSTNDITQVQMLIVMGLEVLLKAPIMAVWALCKISTKNWQWTASTGVAVVVLLSFVCVCVAVALPKFKKLQSLTDNLNRVTRENLTGLNVVRAYNAEGYQQKKFNDANDELTKTQLFANRTMGTMMPGIQMVMNGLMLAIYWIGAYLISNAQMFDKLTIFSDMIVFTQYAMQVVMSFMMLVMIFVLLRVRAYQQSVLMKCLICRSRLRMAQKRMELTAKRVKLSFAMYLFVIQMQRRMSLRTFPLLLIRVRQLPLSVQPVVERVL